MRLTEEAVDVVTRHAVAEYPAECCGIVTGTTDVQSVHRCKNMQDKLHAKDPESHPRTSREAYAMDRDEAERIMRDAAITGEKVIAFYHSHIDCDAYFSRMDKDVQTVFGEPEFPDALHIVVAVYANQVREIKGYLWDGGKQDFVAIPVT
ncbi:MAG: Mov34/MPN/PAD-1 family protein [Nitrospiraceae bacterium]|nr:Mov34/MPN/PAD-1 family protein [Nitrospiraceae bacterium]